MWLSLRSYPQKVDGVKQRYRGEKFNEHYNQAQLFYNSLTEYEKAHIVSAISFELSHCDDPVVYESYTKVLNNVDFELTKKVAEKVGGVMPDAPARPNHGKKSASLSQLYYKPKEPTIKSRRIAILLGDGYDLAEVEGLRAAIKAGSATSWVIGPRRGRVYPKGVKGGDVGVWADHHFEGQRSTMFDAVIVPSGEHAGTLMKMGRAVHWIREAFGHCKAIGALGEGEHGIRGEKSVTHHDHPQASSSSTTLCTSRRSSSRTTSRATRSSYLTASSRLESTTQAPRPRIS